MNENSDELLIVGVLLVLLEEVTGIVTRLPLQAGGKSANYIFVDTSVLIDGRIMAIAASGFITGTLAIPRSVVGELQLLADNADAEKRSRARHGLDIAKELQELGTVDVELFQDGSKAEEGVDERLLMLAKNYDGAICTIDYNLSKVAEVEGIRVCNVNELAKNLRMAYLPGERTKLELVQKGEAGHQGVGYLSDGTMVVVEQASGQVGQTVEIEFIRSLQTAAGKMMFAKKVAESKKPEQSRPAAANKNKQNPNGRSNVKPANNHQQNQNQPNQSQNPRQQQQRKPQQRRRKTQRDHEDNLINLVNNQ